MQNLSSTIFGWELGRGGSPHPRFLQNTLPKIGLSIKQDYQINAFSPLDKFLH